MVEVPGLSYGLFHAVARPVYSWGVIRQVKFPGVNLDIGHIRNLGWSKDNDRQKWIGYNRLRGPHMSALEHAIPELFQQPGPLRRGVEPTRLGIWTRIGLAVGRTGGRWCHGLATERL